MLCLQAAVFYVRYEHIEYGVSDYSTIIDDINRLKLSCQWPPKTRFTPHDCMRIKVLPHYFLHLGLLLRFYIQAFIIP